MIETGLPERFPSLRIGALEAGVAWILFAMKRLNREYLERRRQVPRLQDLPSRYLCRMFFGTQPLDVADGPGFAALNAACGGDLRLMYASDWPHHDFDHPNAIRKLRLSEEAERKVLSENARELFRGL
jgi:predicted TIM-barrel fold metal-dependent hydrolase